MFISEGIYSVKDGYGMFEVVNPTTSDHIFFTEYPLKAIPYSTNNFIELNNLEVRHENGKKLDNISELIRLGHLNSEEKFHLLKLCKKYSDIFYKEDDTLTFTNKVKHGIPTSNDNPIYTKSYRYPYVHKEEVKRQIEDMLEQGIIRPSYSPWSSPVWIVPKKADASGRQKWRLVIDYRKLNEKTISDRYPLPNISEILDKLGRCMYFSTIDLASGFHQIEMDAKDVQKTAFTVEGGHYEYIRMPFGLKNAPSTFQRIMDNILGELVGKICLVYLDYIFIYSSSLDEDILNLRKVFDVLGNSNFEVQLDKSEFLKKNSFFRTYCIH